MAQRRCRCGGVSSWQKPTAGVLPRVTRVVTGVGGGNTGRGPPSLEESLLIQRKKVGADAAFGGGSVPPSINLNHSATKNVFYYYLL